MQNTSVEVSKQPSKWQLSLYIKVWKLNKINLLLPLTNKHILLAIKKIRHDYQQLCLRKGWIQILIYRVDFSTET